MARLVIQITTLPPARTYLICISRVARDSRDLALMRKHVSFAIAAAMLGLAVGFWTITGVVQTTASFGRSRAPAPTFRVIYVMPTAYLPGKEIEPAY